MSANGETDVVMKGITHGACDYLLKPVRIEELRNIWQHVIRRKRSDLLPKDQEHSGSVDNSKKRDEEADISSAPETAQNKKKRKEVDSGGGSDRQDDDVDMASLKKQRVVWSVELHQKFVHAVNQLGVDSECPTNPFSNILRILAEGQAVRCLILAGCHSSATSRIVCFQRQLEGTIYQNVVGLILPENFAVSQHGLFVVDCGFLLAKALLFLKHLWQGTSSVLQPSALD